MDEIDSSNQYYCRDDNDSYYWQNKDDSHNRYLDEVVCPILMKNCIFPTLVPTDEGFPLSVAICMVSPVCPDRALSSSVITRTVHTVYPMYSKAIQLMHTTYMVHLGSILGTHPSAFTGIWYVSLKLMGLPISWNGPDWNRPKSANKLDWNDIECMHYEYAASQYVHREFVCIENLCTYRKMVRWIKFLFMQYWTYRHSETTMKCVGQ